MKTRRPRLAGLTEIAEDFLLDREPPQNTDDCLEWLRLESSSEKVLALWQEYRNELLSEFVRLYPGHRPQTWWAFDAPEPRQRLGGIGTPKHEALNETPCFRYGMPQRWVTRWEENFYSGRAFSIYNEPIGTEYLEGSFTGRALDPSDPPRYESQPAYLARHGLLTSSEKRRLKPEDFTPETVQG
jgi:hypothetical protein